MTLKDFDTLWKEINDGQTIVQERVELEYVFNLIKGCKSYLEVGTAEGKSLYVLSHALDPEASITYIDLGEKHTKPPRDALLAKMPNKNVTEILGDSNSYRCYFPVKEQKFEVVFIDAGHELFNVLIDACWYGPMATKYLIFHDVNIKDVNRAFEWYAHNVPNKGFYRIINSDTYGYGIVEV